MSIDLSALNRVIYEEDVIAAFVRTRRHYNDGLKRSLALLAKTGYTQENRHLLSDTVWGLKHTFRDLDESLKIHYSHEIDTYSTTFNAARIANMESDHKVVLMQLDKIRIMLDGVTDRNIRRKCILIHKEIEVFCQILETHNKKHWARHIKFKKMFEVTGKQSTGI